MPGLISVVVTTYNWPEALTLALASLAEQSDVHYEVIVADDGSRPATQLLVHEWQKKFPVPLNYIWQNDQGFRAARVRNKAVSIAAGDYLILMDGDCFVRQDFVSEHRRLSQENCLVSGQRILLSPEFTQSCIDSQDIHWRNRFASVFRLAREEKLNRCLPALRLPIEWYRLKRPQHWQWVRTCNCALFKKDYLAIGGQDEIYEGWGYEDSDMAIRFINNGGSIKWGAYSSPCFHLWHKENDRSTTGKNWDRLLQLKTSQQIMAIRPIQPRYENEVPLTQ